MSVPKIVQRSLNFLAGKADSFIGTHNGKFHCDEVFACWMLKQLPEYNNHVILRTRNPVDLEKCEIVVDVGGVFDHCKKRYDHHQRDFNETMETLFVTMVDGQLKGRESLQYNTKLSSAGLIYAFYGKDVILTVLKEESVFVEKEEIDLDFYYDRLYKTFVEAIDAVDNGIKAHDDIAKYQIPVTIQSLVEDLNPTWNDTESNEDVCFERAMEMVGKQFKEKLVYLHTSWIPARTLVEKAIENRFEIDSSGKIILLDICCPWKQHLFMIENELDITGSIAYAIYPGDARKSNWRVQSVPVSENSDFDNRKPLPSEWRGVRDEKLASLIGVETAIFVHANGFIGGAKTREDSILMAKKSLDLK